MAQSERHGAAFEYCACEAILSKLKELYPERVRVTARAEREQLLGKEIFGSLSENEKSKFMESAEKISRWLAENRMRVTRETRFHEISGPLDRFLGQGTNPRNARRLGQAMAPATIPLLAIPGSQEVREVEVDRIPDVEGLRGDVTDIRIRFLSGTGSATLNVSLKHRHAALKHPRLTRVPDWIRLTDSIEADKYERAYKEAWHEFFRRAKELHPDRESFKTLKVSDQRFIEENLYRSLCSLVSDFLKKNIRRPSQVQNMFTFMVGTFDYVKFIDLGKRIEVRDFSNIEKPNSVTINYRGGHYIYLTFDNGWKIEGRLHTASSKFIRSIKFDVQPLNLDSVIPPIYI